MIAGSLARRYAKALVAMVRDRGAEAIDGVGADLTAVSDAFVSAPEAHAALSHPGVDRGRRARIVDAVAQRVGAGEVSRRFLKYLVERRRVGQLQNITRAYRDLADAALGRLRAEVVSAETLAPERLDRLRAVLAQRTGKTVLLDHRRDPALIGGVLTRVGNWEFDGSLRAQLRLARESLLGPDDS